MVCGAVTGGFPAPESPLAFNVYTALSSPSRLNAYTRSVKAASVLFTFVQRRSAGSSASPSTRNSSVEP